MRRSPTADVCLSQRQALYGALVFFQLGLSVGVFLMALLRMSH